MSSKKYDPPKVFTVDYIRSLRNIHNIDFARGEKDTMEEYFMGSEVLEANTVFEVTQARKLEIDTDVDGVTTKILLAYDSMYIDTDGEIEIKDHENNTITLPELYLRRPENFLLHIPTVWIVFTHVHITFKSKTKIFYTIYGADLHNKLEKLPYHIIIPNKIIAHRGCMRIKK